MSWKERARRRWHRRPTRRAIATAHTSLVDRLPNVDPKHATTTCWACGQRRPGWLPTRAGWLPTRAHIVPARYGAVPNQPHNYLLLCWSCHRQQPDASPWPVQLAWLLKRPPHPELRRAVEKQLSRRAHNPETEGASPSGATTPAARPDPSLSVGLLALVGRQRCETQDGRRRGDVSRADAWMGPDELAA